MATFDGPHLSDEAADQLERDMYLAWTGQERGDEPLSDDHFSDMMDYFYEYGFHFEYDFEGWADWSD